MSNNRKKFIVLLITFLFLISGVVTTSAIDIKKNVEKSQEVTSKPISLSKTVVLYRHGIDGSITPVKIELNLKDID